MALYCPFSYLWSVFLIRACLKKISPFNICSLVVICWLAKGFAAQAAAPPTGIYHMAPSHWYIGFKDSLLEITVHAENIDMLDVKMEPYEGVNFLGKYNSANRHIAYIQIIINKSAKPGLLHFSAKPASRRVRYVKPLKFSYQLMERSAAPEKMDDGDILYRICLDRFINGSEKNDKVRLANPYHFDRSDPQARHGGDLTGLLAGLDYVQQLGTTAIWLDQIMENDAPERSYLGRSVTDHFLVDPRYGNNSMVLKLQEELQKRKLKLVMDLDVNQVGWFHWMNLNFDTGWFNHPDSSRYPLPDATFLSYPGLSEMEKIWVARHWMEPSLPDLNQENPHINRYLKQVCLWWMEYAGVSAWIIPDPFMVPAQFLKELKNTLRSEFPSVTIFANAKTNNFFSKLSYTQGNASPPGTFQFQKITDYELFNTLKNIAATDSCDKKNLQELFEIWDIQRSSANLNSCISFVDEPSSERIFSACHENLERWKMLASLQLTLPGTPSIFYGSELLATDSQSRNSGLVDFPICTYKDPNQCMQNRSTNEKEALKFIQTCISIRKKNPAFIWGNLLLYAPADGIFTFFRTSKGQKVMVMTNTNPAERFILLQRFRNETAGYTRYQNLLTGENLPIGEMLRIQGQSTLILALLP